MTDRDIWLVVSRALLSIITVFDKKYDVRRKSIPSDVPERGETRQVA